MLQVGSTVDGWHIDAVIHQGSMAVTYAVSHDRHPRACAMKVLYLQEPSFQERLRRAGEALRTIRHPNLLPIIDVITIDGHVAVVSEFIEGTNLSGWCSEDRELVDIVQLFRKACLGLRAVHSHGLVHRNLKPAKILVDLTDRPYIHDFMLGKVLSADDKKAVTQMGTTFGTPQYMAPEQFRGASDVDERADVFSMGCILYEMVTGRRAFDGTGVIEIYQQVAKGDRPEVHAVREDCPPALEAIVVDMLAPDPAARIPSVRELIARFDSDATLRALVNPSFRTATPVSALTSDRPVKTAVTIDKPGPTQGPPQVVAVTPVEPTRQAPPAPEEFAHDPDLEPTVFAGASPFHQGITAPAVLVAPEVSQDSRPSLITFTDGGSDTDIGEENLRRLEAAPPPPAPPPPPGPNPLLLIGGLAVLFVVAMTLGMLVASL